jgi:hypothetical protein
LILRKLSEAKVSDYAFPGQRAGTPLFSDGFRNGASTRGVEAATVHGFRSAFRDWAGNETHFPRELAEHALAHVIGDRAEEAYRRSDALARRRELMDSWARHCEGGIGDKVVAFRRPA